MGVWGYFRQTPPLPNLSSPTLPFASFRVAGRWAQARGSHRFIPSSYPGPGSDKNGNTVPPGLGSGDSSPLSPRPLAPSLPAHDQLLPATSTSTCFSAPPPAGCQSQASAGPVLPTHSGVGSLVAPPPALLPALRALCPITSYRVFLGPRPLNPAFLKSRPFP